MSDDGPPTQTDNTATLSGLPRDIITHHLIPPFAEPAVLLLPESAPPAPQITPSAAPLHALAATSRHLRTLIAAEYSTYCQHQYPSVYAHIRAQASASATPLAAIDWRSKIRQAETLCRRWAKLQMHISFALTGDRTAWRNRNEATRGSPYAPAIDIHDGLTGETLAVGQGTQLAVRNARGDWRTVTRERMVYGMDDYLKVHLLDADTVVASRSRGVEVVTSGDDGKLRVSHTQELRPPGAWNATGGVTSSALDAGSRSLAVTYSMGDDHKLQLFSIRSDDSNSDTTLSLTATSAIPSKPWTSAFLSPTIVATGHRAGLTLHTSTPSGVIHASEIHQPSTSYYRHNLSVHSITPLSAPFSPSLLATGWSDGAVRILDTRTPSYVATYTDAVCCEDVPVYSLLHTAPLANVLLASSSQHHKLMLHDLRYASHVENIFPVSAVMWEGMQSPQSQHDVGGASAKTEVESNGCVMFLDEVAARAVGMDGNARSYRRGRGRSSSSAIYSLAGTAGGSRVYAGVEDGVISMDLGSGERDDAVRQARGGEFFAPVYYFRVGDGRPWWCGGGVEVAMGWRKHLNLDLYS
ncbi:hypothetical protein TWF696_001596 [Orbilia brochopaga]|uniref:F-box domain-containing protein n=1 Tax=Orbilia brochopaga TaxID=3140254 RepID=A0AAV9UDP1_9PEZI